jgi:hypothetical protein
MTGVVVGCFGIVAAVLVVSGVAKVITPAPASSLLSTLRLPASPWVARLFGVVEIAVGTAAVLRGGVVLATAVSVLYLAFAGVVTMARRNGAPTCGCFGASSAPPNRVHVWVNLASAVVALAAAISGDTAVADVLRHQPAAGVPFVILIATGVVLVVGLDTAGAELLDQMSAIRARPPA